MLSKPRPEFESPFVQNRYAYEDIIGVIAKLPEIAALVYRCTYYDGVVNKDHSLDYSGNFNRMLGYDNEVGRASLIGPQ